MRHNGIIEKIEESIKYLSEFEKSKERVDLGDWEERFKKHTSSLIDENLKIKINKLINFRGAQVFITDQPSALLRSSFYSSSPLYYAAKRVLNRVMGKSRGGIKEAIESFKVIEQSGFLPLLKKHPSPSIGNPLNMTHKGYTFTNRHLRHIYLVGLLKKQLGEKIKEDSVFLDIGSSYGLFSSLMKKEMPKTHHVLVDLPAQLVLAHYYLSAILPDAKIAGFKEVINAERLDESFIKQYDFVLVPTSLFDKLSGNSVNVISNYASLSEMSRAWFDTYINSDVFKTAEFFYTLNRYDAYPTYTNNLTILDYPLYLYETVYMRTWPLMVNYYTGLMLFFCKRHSYPSQFFHYIGRRKVN